MHVITGRGGVLSVFLALFMLLGFIVLKMAFYLLVAMTTAVLLVVATGQVLWDYRKAAKLRKNMLKEVQTPVKE